MNITFLNSNKKHNWVAYILVLIIIGMIIMWAKGCGNNNATWEQKLADVEDRREREVDSVNKEMEKERDILLKEVFYWKDSAESVLAEADVLRYERNEAWKELAKEKDRGDKLVAKIKEVNGTDSADCLELADLYTDASGKVIFYKTKSDELIKKLDTAGKYKDKIINGLTKIADSTKSLSDYNLSQYNALKSSFDRYKPHGSGWIGVDVTALPGMFLAGPQFAWQTKKGTQYTIAGGLDSKTIDYYVRLGVLWKISFR